MPWPRTRPTLRLGLAARGARGRLSVSIQRSSKPSSPRPADADWPGRGAGARLRSLAAVRFGRMRPRASGPAEVPKATHSLTDGGDARKRRDGGAADTAGDSPRRRADPKSNAAPTKSLSLNRETAYDRRTGDRAAERRQPRPDHQQVFSRRADR